MAMETTIIPQKLNLSENVFQFQTSLINTEYEEKIRFYVPSYATKVEMKVIGYKPTDLTLEHNHGSHRHSIYQDDDGNWLNYAIHIENAHAYWRNGYVSSVTIGSGRAPVTASYPKGLTVRINGSSEHTIGGDGTADIISDWINITTEVTKGNINTIEAKATTPGCKAIIIIRYAAVAG